jgi:hypothetical protein
MVIQILNSWQASSFCLKTSYEVNSSHACNFDAPISISLDWVGVGTFKPLSSIQHVMVLLESNSRLYCTLLIKLEKEFGWLEKIFA